MQLDFNVEEQTLRLVSLKKVVADSVDYLTCKFTFSEDWDGVTKSATFFPTNGEPYTQVLEDDGCVIPHEVIKTPLFKVSVFGGDLITTNKVIVGVVESGYVIGETPKPPTPDVYTQILNKVSETEKNTKAALETVEEKVDEVLEAAAKVEETEKEVLALKEDIEKTEKEINEAYGEAVEEIAQSKENALNQISGATESGLENIASGISAIEETTHNAIEEVNTAKEEAVEEIASHQPDLNVFSNALKGTTSGEAIGITDISPIEHNMEVSVRGKNLLPLSFTVELPYTTNGITFDYNGDGGIKVSGTATDYASINYKNVVLVKSLTYRLAHINGLNGVNTFISYKDENGTSQLYATKTNANFTFNDTYTYLRTFLQVDKGVTVNQVIYPMLILSTEDRTKFAPYIEDISTVKLYKQGKNLFNADLNTLKTVTYITTSGVESTRTGWEIELQAGVTYTVNAIPKNGDFTESYLYGCVTNSSDNVQKNTSLVGNKAIYSHTFTAEKGWKWKVYDGISSNSLSKTKKMMEQFYIQLEVGTPTEYEPYIEPTVYDVNADGTVEGVTSLYPSTTLYTDTSGAVIDCTYNRDINKAFAELQNAIIAIGGLE